VRTEFKLHRPFSGLKKSPVKLDSGLFKNNALYEYRLIAIDFRSALAGTENPLRKPYKSADHTGSRPLTAFPGGLTITVMKFLVVIGAKITLLEFFHQPLLFHGTTLCGF
jgi:hypothetical protein